MSEEATAAKKEPRIPEGTGARIKARRKELGLTQKVVARRTAEAVGRDYGEGWLAQIERGQASLLLDAAIALADTLNLSMDYMLGRTAYLAAAVPPSNVHVPPTSGSKDASGEDHIVWD